MQTSPLRSGDKLPTHPDHTTALKVTDYGRVYDDADGHELMSGLHRAEITMLMTGQKGGLDHLYRFAYVPTATGKIIVHTRGLVTIDVTCEPIESESLSE